MRKLIDATNMTPEEVATAPAQRLKLKTLRVLSNTALMNAAAALRAYSDALNERLPDHVADTAMWDALMGNTGAKSALQSVVQGVAQSIELPDGAVRAELESRLLENMYSQIQAGAFVESIETQAQADALWARDLANALTESGKRVA